MAKFDYFTDEDMEIIFAEVNTAGTVEQIKDELNRKLSLARKYGYDEYGDEVIRYMELLNNARHGKA